MDSLVSCTESHKRLGDVRAEASGTTDVNVRVAHVAHELSQGLPIQVDFLTRPDDLVQLTAALAHELRHFLAMYEILDRRGAQDHGDVSSLGEVFE